MFKNDEHVERNRDATKIYFEMWSLKKTMDRRRVMFTDTPLKAVTEQCGAVPFTRNCMAKPHTLVRQLNSQRFDYLLAFEYCKTTPGFDQLNGDEKAIFFRLCAITFCLLDIGWLSSQITVPGEEYIVYTDGSVSSVRDLSIGWDDEDGLEMDGKSNSVKVKYALQTISFLLYYSFTTYRMHQKF
uniref:NR LBD domain-containing protein n=1 Tax=Heterorhabditis bacteriophora TaxID=37862 RepID=A0A1I7X4Z3_HETBA